MAEAGLKLMECPNCGAPVSLTPGATTIICEYCNKQIHFDDGIQRTFSRHEEIHVDAYKMAQLELDKQRFEHERKHQNREDVFNFINGLFHRQNHSILVQQKNLADERMSFSHPQSAQRRKKVRKQSYHSFWSYLLWFIVCVIVYHYSGEFEPLSLVAPLILTLFFPRFNRFNFLLKLLIWIVLQGAFYTVL